MNDRSKPAITEPGTHCIEMALRPITLLGQERFSVLACGCKLLIPLSIGNHVRPVLAESESFPQPNQPPVNQAPASDKFYSSSFHNFVISSSTESHE
jgi:hypothetical protein